MIERGPGFVYVVSLQSANNRGQGRTERWCLEGRWVCGLGCWCCLGGLVLGGYECGGRSSCGLYGLNGFWGGRGGSWGGGS